MTNLQTNHINDTPYSKIDADNRIVSNNELDMGEVEKIIRLIHIDGYERGKQQVKTPYEYTLPNDDFLKEKWQQLSNLIKEIVNTKIYDETLHGEMEVVGFSIDRLRATQLGKATNLGFNIGGKK
jgi:hypothetical protein